MREFFGIKNSLAIATVVAAGFFQAAAATISWTNTAGGNWNAPTNWSPNTVPAAGDTVFMTNAGTYAVAVNVSATLAGLSVGSTNGGTVTVNLAATTLTLNGASFFETNSVFNLSGGTLDGTGTAVFAGQFTWSGGVMESTGPGGGKTVFTNTATVNVSSGGTKAHYRRAVDNYTTVSWTGGQWNAGFGALWVNHAGAVLDVAGDLALAYGGGGNLLTIQNNGLLQKSAGPGLATLHAVVQNGNQVRSQSGTLSLIGGGVASGAGFQAAGGCQLDFGGGTHTLLAGVNFSGNGLFRVNGSGILNLAAPQTVGPAFELASGGTLDGTNTVVFTGPFTWSGGVMESTGAGGGKTVFTNTATVNVSSGGTKAHYRRAVDNYTTVSWTGGQWNAGFGALWVNHAGAVLDVAGDLALAYGGGGNLLTIQNNGLLQKSAGTGLATLHAVVQNGNQVSSQSGTLSLIGGGVASVAGYHAAAGCQLDFGGGTHTLLAGVNFSGNGLFRVNGSGILNLAAPQTVGPAFELASGGTLDGTNTVIFTGPFTWSGGVMESSGVGGGRTVLTNTAAVNVSSGGTKTHYRRAVDNHTTVSWTGGQWNAGFGALWVNHAGAVLDVAGDLALAYGGGGNLLTIQNNGLLQKSAGTGLATLHAVVQNGNQVSSQSGTLSLIGGGVASVAGYHAAAGCQLDFGGGTHTLLAGVNFSGNGLFRVNGSGILNLAAPQTVGPAFELASGGTLDGTNTVIFTGPFTWSGGVMESSGVGGGRTVLTNTAAVNVSSGGTKTHYRRAVDNYTTVSWTGGQWNAGFGALWVNHAGAVLDVAGDLALAYGGGGNLLTIQNNGLLQKSAGPGLATLHAVVQNGNQVRSQSGTLSLIGGGVASGAGFQAAGGCQLDFGGGTHTLLAGVNFSGNGLFRVNGSGILNLAAPQTVGPAFELASGGTLDGTNTVVFTGPFTWSGGVMESTGAGGGKTVFTNTATVNVSSGGTKAHYRRAVDNYTTVSWTGGQWNAGFGALWVNHAGAVLDVAGDLALAYGGGGNLLTIQNNGLLQKSAGTGLATLHAVVQNGNQVSSQSGTLSLIGGGVASVAGYHAAAGCQLDFGGGTHTLLAGVNFSGNGLFRVNGSGILNLAAPQTVGPAFELASGGTLDGTNTVIFTGPFTWSGGVMESSGVGGGRTVLTNTAAVNVSSGGTKTHYRRAVDNHTTVSWTGGQWNAGFGALWINHAGAVLDVAGDLALAYGGGGNLLTIQNNGLVRKSAGTGVATLSANVTNTATVRSQSGYMSLPQSYVQTSGTTELAGGNISGTLLDIRGGLLTGTGNVAANVSNGAQTAPGTGVGLMTITNTIPQTYTSSTNSLLTFQIGGLAPGSGHDQLVVNSTAALAGTLRAELADGYVPTPGNTYTVMTFTARSGVFTNFSFPNYDFAVVQSSTNVILIASNAVPAVSVTAPSNQLVCTPFVIQTAASDLDGNVTNLSLYFDGNLLASYTNGAPREVQLTYDFPAPITVSARATDEKGGIRETNITMLFYTLPLNTINLGGKLASGEFKICMLGESGKNYDVLVNTNLAFPSNWTAIGVMENTNGIWRFTDPAATNSNRRYYRARQQ